VTSTLETPTIRTPVTFPIDGIESVAFDLYKDIHKGIRAELFRVTASAGSLDPAERCAREELAADVRNLFHVLMSHAEHEDDFVQPILEAHVPDLAAVIAVHHPRLEARMVDIQTRVDRAATAPAPEQRVRVHDAYRELAAFTGSYLEHQDFEERDVMPALEQAIGVDAVLELDHTIVASIPPDEVATGLSLMLPAMNVDDRTELLGGMRVGAPPEVFAGVWALTGSLLAEEELRTLATRLEI
jgi:hypothetical protein